MVVEALRRSLGCVGLLDPVRPHLILQLRLSNPGETPAASQALPGEPPSPIAQLHATYSQAFLRIRMSCTKSQLLDERDPLLPRPGPIIRSPDTSSMETSLAYNKTRVTPTF